MGANLEYTYLLKDKYSPEIKKIIRNQIAFEKQYRKSMGKINASVQHHIKKVKEQCKVHRQTGIQTRQTIGKNVAAVVHSTKAIRKQGAEHLKTMRRARQSAQSVSALAKKTGAYTRSAENVRRSAQHWNKNALAIDKAQRAQSKFNATAKKAPLSKRAGQKGRQMVGEGVQTAATGLGLLYAIKQPIDVAASYELAFKDVKKSVNGTDKELMALRQKMKKFRGAAFNDLAAIASDVGKMGIKANENMGMTALIAKGAQALDFVPEEAVAQIGKILSMTNQMHKPVEATQKIIDSVAHLENTLEAVKARDVLTVWKRVSDVMSGLNFDHDQMAGMSAALVQLGVAPEIAARGFKSLINHFKKNKLGQGYLKTLRKEGPEGLRKILADMAKMTEGKRLKLAGVFGVDLIEKLLKQRNLDKVFKNIEVSKGSKGAMDKEWTLFMGTFDQKKKNFIKSYNNMMDTIGKPLHEVALSFMKFFTPIFNWMAKFATKNPGLVKGIGYFFAAIAIGMVVFGVFVALIGSLIMGFGGFLIAVKGIWLGIKGFIITVKILVATIKILTFVFKILGIIMMANPIILIVMAIIAAIAALVFIVVYAKKKLGSWGEAFKFLGQLMLKSLLTPINIIITVIANLLQAMSFLPGKMGDAAGKAADKLRSLKDMGNILLTGNKSDTFVGMGQDLYKSKDLDSYKNIATGNVDTAVKKRTENVGVVRAMMEGNIKVEAEPGSKVTKQEFNMMNLGENIAFAN